MLIGHVEKAAMILTTHKKYAGNYDVLMEARLLEAFDKNGPALFSLAAPFGSQARYISFGYMTGNIELYEWTALRDGVLIARKSYADLPKKPNPKDWVTYEVRVRDKEITALVNGTEIGRRERAPEFEEAQSSILVQFSKVEFRSVVVVGR